MTGKRSDISTSLPVQPTAAGALSALCSSGSETELSLSEPALGTRKRSGDSDFSFTDVIEGKGPLHLKEEASTHGDYKCNAEVERPVTIATPDQINSRSFDQEKVSTPSSCSNPVEEKVPTNSANIVKKLADQVFKAQSSTKHPQTSTEKCTNHSPNHISSQQSPTPCQSQAAHPQCPGGRGRGVIQPRPLRCGQTRQTHVGAVPPVRPAGSRMLRPLRPSLPRNPRMMGQHRPGQAMMRPRLSSVGPRLPNARSSAHSVKHRSLSTPQYKPLLVELDASPSPPPTDSVVTRLTSLGLSVATVEKVPPHTKQGWVLPPGLSVTRAPSTDEGTSASIPDLARALLQLGEVDGRKRMVQYQLTEGQVRGLITLGLREEN